MNLGVASERPISKNMLKNDRNEKTEKNKPYSSTVRLRASIALKKYHVIPARTVKTNTIIVPFNAFFKYMKSRLFGSFLNIP
jgi:hypothetical protein